MNQLCLKLPEVKSDFEDSFDENIIIIGGELWKSLAKKGDA